MVGEGQNEFRKGGAADENQKEPNQKQPGEELETLEEENEERIESLKGESTPSQMRNLSAMFLVSPPF